MKRKILIIMLCLMAAICLVCSFAACDKIAFVVNKPNEEVQGGGNEEKEKGEGKDEGKDEEKEKEKDEPADSEKEVKIKSAVLRRCGAEPKLLWTLEDVANEKFDTFGTEWQITYDNGETKRESLTAAQLVIDDTLRIGACEIVAKYAESVTDTLSVFIDDNSYEISAEEVVLTKQADAIGLLDRETQTWEVDGTAELTGYFQISVDYEYTRYYGTQKLKLSFLSGLDCNTAGKQRCKVIIENGNARSGEEEPLGELDVLVYETYENSNEIVLKEITAYDQDGTKLLTMPVNAKKPFIDKETYLKTASAEDSRYTEGYFGYKFNEEDYVIFRGGNDEHKKLMEEQEPFGEGLKVTKAVNKDITSCGKRTIQFSYFEVEQEFSYEVYDGSNPVRSASVEGLDSFEITLQDVTGESVKDALVGKVLNYTAYNDPFNQESVELTASQIKGYQSLNAETFAVQHVYLEPGINNVSIPVKVVREYTIEGATLVQTLHNSNGVDFTFTKTSLNDLANTEADDVTEIELYDNGCVVIKNTKNGLGNVLMEYQLDGNQLHFSRHGLNCGVVRVDLSEKTFRAFWYDKELDQTIPPETQYLYHHAYVSGSSFGYSFWISLYDDGKGSCCVHRTGYAAGPDKNGNSYQIAGDDVIAGFEIKTVNGEKHAFINTCDREIEFVCGEELEDNRFYRLTPVGSLL